MSDQTTILAELNEVLEQRKHESAEDSYVASLYASGINKILEKVGEEATEVIIAGKEAAADPTKQDELVKEIADLWFHTMVLLASQDMHTKQVLSELARRFGIGGHDEKASRGQ
jgi:phosphoribosyl-ATP pyrophosphohydrolase